MTRNACYDGPFSTALIATLCSSAIKGSDRAFDASSPLAENLAVSLNELRGLYLAWQTEIPEQIASRTAIGSAIQTLLFELPKTRVIYDADLQMMVRALDGERPDSLKPFLGRTFELRAEAENRLCAFDALVEALRNAAMAGIPIGAVKSFSWDPSRGREKNHWRGFAAKVAELFATHVPGRSSEARYRFVHLAIPYITDEHPSLQSVKECVVTNSAGKKGVELQ